LKPVIIGSKRALLLRQRLVGHRDERVGERVVIEVRVAIEVVRRREIAETRYDHDCWSGMPKSVERPTRLP
jgi:hypothetical protein